MMCGGGSWRDLRYCDDTADFNDSVFLPSTDNNLVVVSLFLSARKAMNVQGLFQRTMYTLFLEIVDIVVTRRGETQYSPLRRSS